MQPATTRTSPSPSVTPDTTTPSSTKPRRKDLKAEKKLHRALNPTTSHSDQSTLTSAAVAAIGRAMHPTATDDNGGLREFDDPDFLAHLVWRGQDAYILPSTTTTTNVHSPIKPRQRQQQQVPNFSAEKARVLRVLGVLETGRGGKKGQELRARVARLVLRDFEEVWREERETARRRGGFLRYMSRKTLMRILEMKRERRDVVVVGEVVEEVDEWGGWEEKFWFRAEDEDEDEEEALGKVSDEESLGLEEAEEAESATANHLAEEEKEEAAPRPTLEELLSIKEMPSSLGIVPECRCGFCFEHSKLAETFLKPFVIASQTDLPPKVTPARLPPSVTSLTPPPQDKPLTKKRTNKKPSRKPHPLTRDQDWATPDLSYYLNPPATDDNANDFHSSHPTDPVRLLVPLGPATLSTHPMPRATALHLLRTSTTHTSTALPPGLLPLLIDEPLAACLLGSSLVPPAPATAQMSRNAGPLAEQIWQFHALLLRNRRNAALYAQLRAGAGTVEPGREWQMARGLGVGVERVCVCGGVRTERVVVCGWEGCEVGVFHARCVGVTAAGVGGERWVCAGCRERVGVELDGVGLGGGDGFLGRVKGLVVKELLLLGGEGWHGFFEEGEGLDRVVAAAVEEERGKRRVGGVKIRAAWTRGYKRLSEEVRGWFELGRGRREGERLPWKPQDDKARLELSTAPASATDSDVSVASTATGFWAVGEKVKNVGPTEALLRRCAARDGWNEKVARFLRSPYF